MTGSQEGGGGGFHQRASGEKKARVCARKREREGGRRENGRVSAQ